MGRRIRVRRHTRRLLSGQIVDVKQHFRRINGRKQHYDLRRNRHQVKLHSNFRERRKIIFDPTKAGIAEEENRIKAKIRDMQTTPLIDEMVLINSFVYDKSTGDFDMSAYRTPEEFGGDLFILNNIMEEVNSRQLSYRNKARVLKIYIDLEHDLTKPQFVQDVRMRRLFIGLDRDEPNLTSQERKYKNFLREFRDAFRKRGYASVD